MRTRTNSDGSVWTRDGRLLVHYPELIEEKSTIITEDMVDEWDWDGYTGKHYKPLRVVGVDPGCCYSYMDLEFDGNRRRMYHGDVLACYPSGKYIVSVETSILHRSAERVYIRNLTPTLRISIGDFFQLIEREGQEWKDIFYYV